MFWQGLRFLSAAMEAWRQANCSTRSIHGSDSIVTVAKKSKTAFSHVMTMLQVLDVHEEKQSSTSLRLAYAFKMHQCLCLCFT